MSTAPFQSNATTADNVGTTVNAKIASAVSTADSDAGQSVQSHLIVQQARVARFKRVAVSAAAQYGSNSPQALAAQAAVKSSQLTVARITAVRQQIAVPAPQVAANGWALYGHVYDAQLKPVTAYTVFLVDQQNAYQGAYGFTYTDSNGLFVLHYPGAESTPEAVPLFIEIVNAKAQPVYLSPTAFQPTIGAATYQDITLPAGEPVIGDPPAALRAIAFPQTNKS